MGVVMEVGSPSIKPINKGVIHKICAGQVILDLSTAVKELVENSLDAGATTIEVLLKDYGEDSFQVIDNGCGISPSDFKILALKHHTSKLVDFPDLQSLATFGFRGEALSSLCSLGNVSVETRTKSEAVATYLTFDHYGQLVDERKTARQIGTTVTVKNLFSNLPVRSKEFSRNIRKEYGKLTTLLNAYAVIARGVRLVCTNTTGKSARSTVLKTQGSHSIKDNIITVFGMSTFTCLEPLNIDLTDCCKVEGFVSKSGNGSGRNSGDRQFFFVNGRPVDMPKISKLVNELYRGANSRQYPIAIMNFTIPATACDVNVTPDKRKIFFSEEGLVLQSLKEGLEKIYSPGSVNLNLNKLHNSDAEQANSSHLPGGLSNSSQKTCLNRLQTEEKSSPLECKFPEMIENFHKQPDTAKSSHDGSEKTLGTDFFLKHQNMNQYSHSDWSNVEQKFGLEILKKELENDTSSSLFCPRSSQSTLTKFLTIQKRPENISSALSELPILRNGTLHCESPSNQPEICRAAGKSSIDHHIGDCNTKANEDSMLKRKRTEGDYYRRHTSCVLGDNTGMELSTGGLKEGELDLSKMNPENASRGSLGHVSSVLNTFRQPQNIRATYSESVEHGLEDISDVSVTDTPPVSALKRCSTLQFTIQDLLARRQKRMPRLSCAKSRRPLVKRCYTAATVDLLLDGNDERKTRALDAATNELDRLFQKKDFSNMKVVGQFNLGFIIGKLDQDLFIVDQHAADEKYNYERLSQSTVMNQQPLLKSQTLELSPEEEVVASMHIDIIRKNGFSLKEDMSALPGQRFMLTAVPFSKNIMFGAEDVKELISTLSDGHGDCSIMSSYKMNTANSICPSRVRAMLASRACRSSVMVGDALGRNEMKKILEHLADLNSPWNCPHGRPTMRHLIDLSTVHENMEERMN